MSSKLDQLNALQGGALAELNDKVRQHTKNIRMLEGAIVKFRSDRDQLAAEVEELKKEKASLKSYIEKKNAGADAYRADQINKIEEVARRAMEQEKKAIAALKPLAEREQAAKKAEGSFNDKIDRVAIASGAFKDTVMAAVDDALALIKE